MITFFSEFQQPKCPEGRSCFHHRNGPVDNAGARTVYREAIHGNVEQVTQDLVHHQQNILNCVYLPGQDVDIQGKSGVNTLRTVLDQAFGMELPMVEPDHDESKEFDP